MAYPSSAPNSAEHAALIGHTIDKNRLQFVSVLGLGAYGVVYLARDVSAALNASSATDPTSPYSGTGFYAVKCLNKIGLDSRQRSFQRREIALHTLASSHPNIVSLHRVVETSSVIYVILSFCPDGDLFSMITEQSRYLGDDELIRSVFLQIIDAVEHCHNLGIYHRDLKPENILCCDGGQTVMLADFGLATAEKTSWDFGCGSTFYMSPECQGGIYQRLGSYSTLQNDVWSLGVILVNLTCGRNPWKQACPDDETFRAYLDNPNFLQSILPISNACNSLLKHIFAVDPAQRITLSQLKSAAMQVKRWTMTEAELEKATRATKEAARAFIGTNVVNHAQHPADIPATTRDVETPSEKPMTCYADSLETSSESESDMSSSDDYSFATSIDFPKFEIRSVAPMTPPQENGRVKPLPSLPSSFVGLHTPPHTPERKLSISDMDIDSISPSSRRTPPLVARSPHVGFSTPRARHGGFRRDSGASETPSSGSSSSSSGESWNDLPPTPDTPSFTSALSQQRNPLDSIIGIQQMQPMHSITSTKASFEDNYADYAAWADESTEDVFHGQQMRVPPSPLQKQSARFSQLSSLSQRLLGSPVTQPTFLRPKTAESRRQKAAADSFRPRTGDSTLLAPPRIRA